MKIFSACKTQIFDICIGKKTTQWTIICSKSTLKALEQGVKYV